MEIRYTKQEREEKREQITKNILAHSAVADIAINDLGFTLDDPEFFSPFSIFSEYSITSRLEILDSNSEVAYAMRIETLSAMSIYLCLLNGGIDLAKKLAKDNGLLNFQLTDTITVTEEYIEKGMKNQQISFILDELEDSELYLINNYLQLFIAYCLDCMDENQLEERINSKIKTYYNPKVEF